jgi:hypothetical protein
MVPLSVGTLSMEPLSVDPLSMDPLSDALEKINMLTNENKKLKSNIQNLQDLIGYDICKYFFRCNSLKDTANHFYFESAEDCYYALVDYNGCSDSANDADDYKEVFGDRVRDSSEESGEEEDEEDSGEEEMIEV